MIRLTKSVGRENPIIFVRLMYVLIEKGKLIKEQENDKFLNIPAKKRGSINKDNLELSPIVQKDIIKLED